MTPTQIQNQIEELRTKTEPNSITPDTIATILTNINNSIPTTTPHSTNTEKPRIYCEVVNNKLYLRNYEYYANKGFVPVLFRYVKWRNKYEVHGEVQHGPKSKGWHVCGKQRTLHIDDDGLVLRSFDIVYSTAIPSSSIEYNDEASTFAVARKDIERRVTWGNSHINMKEEDERDKRMLRLSFAIAYAPVVTLDSKTTKLEDIESNLAPFFLRGFFDTHSEEYRWSFSR